MSTKNIKANIHKINDDPSLNKITFIILAAGVNNTRGENIPKSLIQLSNSQLLIDYQINLIRKIYKNADIIVATGFQSDCIINHIVKKQYDVRVVENIRYTETTSLESLRLSLNASKPSNFIFCHGDCLFNKESIIVRNSSSAYLVANKVNKENKKIGISQQDGVVRRLSYGLQREWAEMCYIPLKYFNTVRDRIKSYKDYHNVFEMVNGLIEHDGIEFTTHFKDTGSRQVLVHRIKQNENIDLSSFR